MIFDTLKKENMLALKNKDMIARSILPTVINKCMLLNIEKKTKNEELTDGDCLSIITKTIKELDDEIIAFESANRPEKVIELKNQKEFLKKYLPAQLSKEDIIVEIKKLEDKSIPNIMKHFKTNFQGKCDMKLVNDVAKTI